MKKNIVKGLLAASLMAMLLCGCGKETVATESQTVAAAGTSETVETSQAEESAESSAVEETKESAETEEVEESTEETETEVAESSEESEESQPASSEPAATEKPAATAAPQTESTESSAAEATPAPTPAPTPKPADCSNGHADPGMCVESDLVDDTHMRMVTHEFCRACGWESYTVDSSRMDPDTFVLYSESITHDPVPHNCSR